MAMLCHQQRFPADSPSGCTFWGKRPWSLTQILWQLGMVLGAPMVISLVAGIAVPVITIGIPIYMGRKVLGQSQRSSLLGCQQCLSVTSSVLLSLFVSPIITAVTVDVGVPLVLTYVYGVVVLSLFWSRWGCGGGHSPPGDLGVVELENLTKLNELWSVLPSPRTGEDGAPDTTASFPSSSHSPRPGVAWKERDSQSASTVALAGSVLSEGQDMSYREGVNIEVEVSTEAVPHPARQQSLCSVLSGQSLSGDSLGGTSDKCSTMGIPAE